MSKPINYLWTVIGNTHKSSEVAEVAIGTCRGKKIQNWLPNTLCEASNLAQFSILLKLCSVAHVIIMLYIGLRGSYFLRLKYVYHNFVKFLSCYCTKKEKLSLIQKKIKEKVK